MANVKFSGLPAASLPLGAADILAVTQAATSKQVAFSAFTGAGTGHGDSIYTILSTDRVVFTNAAFTTARTWTLPTAASYPAYTELVIADLFKTITATNTLTIARQGADTIQGAATSVVLISPLSVLVLVSDGVSNWVVVSRSPAVRVISITTGTSYTPSVGVKALYVECQGAGGAGGGAATSSSTSSVGSGGGSGAYSAVYISNPKTSYVLVIGAGGTGVSGGTGNTGTDTTFDSPSVCTAKGGVGGTVLAAGTSVVGVTGGLGGAFGSGVGDLVMNGAQGYNGMRFSGTQGFGGMGGGTTFGSGGAGATTISGGAAGALSYVFGGGGGGAATITTVATGGPGAQGFIRIWEFF